VSCQKGVKVHLPRPVNDLNTRGKQEGCVVVCIGCVVAVSVASKLYSSPVRVNGYFSKSF